MKKKQKPQADASVPRCEPGTHVDDIVFPQVPKDELSVAKRIQKMEEAGADPFEIAAAKHNYKNGHITKGNQISRPRTPKEAEDGKKGDHQQIKARCRVCGFEREIDMAIDKHETVECKNQEGSLTGTDQFKNNKQFASLMPRKVSYKVPQSQIMERRMESLRDFAQVIGVPFP